MQLPRVHIELPARRHEAEFLAAVQRSRELFRRWGMPPTTPARFQKLLKTARSESNVTYFLVNDDGELVGAIIVSQIVRGRFHSAYLGYYAFVPHAGRGYISSGLVKVIRRAFGKMRLHRLEANIQPGNAASIALVKRLGFRREGLSKRYLKIDGKWRDHERWAITKEDWVGRDG